MSPQFPRVVPRLRCVILTVIPLAMTPLSVSAAAEHHAVTQLPGYKFARVHYGPMNKMIMPVRINGQRADLLVDTGSNQVILDTETAELCGVRPSQRGPLYIGLTKIQGESLPLGFVQNISAGTTSFGSTLVALRKSPHAHTANASIDGVLGLDILFRHKAVINSRTRLVLFKIDPRSADFNSVAGFKEFTRVPIRREQTGALTVPCSIRGQSRRLVLDTGAFVTILHEGFIKSLGLPLEPTRVSAQFGRGPPRRINTAKIGNLSIGMFRVAPKKLGVAPLPRFALQQGDTRIAGILGMDTLYNSHAIIDLNSMNLFLK